MQRLTRSEIRTSIVVALKVMPARIKNGASGAKDEHSRRDWDRQLVDKLAEHVDRFVVYGLNMNPNAKEMMHMVPDEIEIGGAVARPIPRGGDLPRGAQIMPAQPGTAVLDIVGEDVEDIYMMSSPVIAWAVVAGGPPIPITARGPNDGLAGEDFAIEFPSGEVVSPATGTWWSRAEFLKGMGVTIAEDQLAA